MRIPFFSIPLRYFFEVAKTGSVSQAAVELHVAASAVSRQIAKLEDALGAPLFQRKTRGMALTQAGERLMAHVRTGTADAERVIEQVRGLAGQAGQQVRIACTEGFGAGFLPAVISEFRDTHPEALIELDIAAPDTVSARLLRGETDLALKYSVAPQQGATVLHGALAPVYALMAPGHPLARKRQVSVAEVARYPLAIGTKGTTARQLFDWSCSVQGLQYRAAVVSNYSSALLPLVRGGDIALSSYLTVAYLVQQGLLVAVPFEEPQMQQRRLELLSLQGRSLAPLVQTFAQHLVLAIEKYGKRKIGRRRPSV